MALPLSASGASVSAVVSAGGSIRGDMFLSKKFRAAGTACIAATGIILAGAGVADAEDEIGTGSAATLIDLVSKPNTGSAGKGAGNGA
ncbi:hypothetical protein NDR87_27740 [Nocardia sp. CDC159]|uniref:Uncharacterized protein n=1 Tax=Nocardia pulmonis TaxID=2951408 RepID=A0A9X2ED85_9NOCA|nr:MULTISPECIES: hypothetical protein [Nocardia]MCM6777285.1 hypothetical protein [Nocardia pulmonis]MCM6790170.1 hypothetical protein [Nocardia sp. CDC159]